VNAAGQVPYTVHVKEATAVVILGSNSKCPRFPNKFRQQKGFFITQNSQGRLLSEIEPGRAEREQSTDVIVVAALGCICREIARFCIWDGSGQGDLT